MLNAIRKGREVMPPLKIVLYGVAGIGKTTFGGTFESPILLPIEDGIGKLNINHFPVVKTYQDIIDAITALHEDHQYKTLVVDSLDWAEPLVWEATCQANEKASIEAFGYGKGYVEADKWWRMLMGGFDSLRANKGMQVVLLAHSEIKNIAPPDSDTYDRWQLRLHRRAFNLWKDWSEILLFLNYRISIKKEDKGFNDRTRAVGSGDRLVYTAERPAFDAKNRWSLPDEIFIGKDETFSAFHAALETATGGRYVNPGKGAEKKGS